MAKAAERKQIEEKLRGDVETLKKILVQLYRAVYPYLNEETQDKLTELVREILPGKSSPVG